MIEQIISRRLRIALPQVQGTVRLLRDGATIPFISRYRKEATGSNASPNSNPAAKPYSRPSKSRGN